MYNAKSVAPEEITIKTLRIHFTTIKYRNISWFFIDVLKKKQISGNRISVIFLFIFSLLRQHDIKH